MAKLKVDEGCEDKECVFCSGDDAEAAFWDEFMSLEEAAEEKERGEDGLAFRVVDERTGERREFKRVRVMESRTKVD